MDLEDILQCPSCRKSLNFSSFDHDCGRKIYIADGKYFFSDILQSVTQSKQKETWSKWRTSNHFFFEKNLKAITQPGKNQIIFDLGAGAGDFLSLYQNFGEVISVDLVPYPSVNVVTNLDESFPFIDNSIDIIILSNFLEHSFDPQFLLSEIFRVLKVGGHVLVTVPFLIQTHQAPFDYGRYTEFGLRHLFNQSKFEVLSLDSLVDTHTTLESHIDNYFESYFRDSKSNFHNKLNFKLKLLFIRITLNAVNLLTLFRGRQHFSSKYTIGYGLLARK